MSDKKIKYEVRRSMQCGAESFERGDTRELTEAEALPLLKSGALCLPGEEPAERELAVQHTFGAAPQESPADYTVASPDNAVQLPKRQQGAKKAN
ncbi:hypothetical protein SAMN03159338_4269 [Sphingomonas sp. NFR04]|uniref:hypothetical protein n=1 Tax=Sphingomonas sp. NFR04 TaxID=1566283 RepID=UPI0008EE2DA4|nr:hypothetical protein [Sphingomonas sp. NFR04]SFK44434.1 hypothetical protein SAMN03159338_4269 [Sphingomonas sp. NFR04]